MPTEPIRCPKCGHEQTNRVECEACGLLFRKFEQAREREQEKSAPPAQQAEPAPQPAGSATKIGSTLILVALTAALTYYLTAGSRPEPVQPLPPPPAATAVEKKPMPEVAKPVPQRLEQPRETATTAPLGSIEQAKNGTVAIETPWGTLGSGFFLTDSIVVTNKHVVEQKTGQLEEFRHKVKTNRRMIELEQEQIAEIRNWLKRMEDGPARRQLVITLQEKERQLAKALPAQQEAEARLKEMEKPRSTSEIKIFLADGSEHNPQSVRVSAKRDLAILSLYSTKAMPLKPADKSTLLQQGSKVYTIGNPSGLRNTVTAGIFSGYRQDKESGEILLQTDAPINPGNSGGPLIDELGQVHGVNFMIFRDTQGIGFAIPIQAVFEEFSINRP